MSSSFNIFSLAALLVLYVCSAEENPECIPKEPEPGKKPETCCKTPDIMKIDDKELEKMFEECMTELKEKHADIVPAGPPKPGSPPPEKFFECIQECVYTKTKMMVDNKPVEEEIKKKGDSYIKDSPVWVPIHEAAVKKCVEDGPKRVKEEAVCKSGAHQISICIMREMYMQCPKENWNDSEGCKADKALLEKCPDMMPMQLVYQQD